jgi:hypothetical protein
VVEATALYRRRQRRRAVIAWSTLGALAVVALAIVLGGEDHASGPSGHIFPAEMTSSQYQQLHKGETGLAVFKAIGSTGLQEDEVQETDLLHLFLPPPAESTCSFWTLSDAPDHQVRLCFSTTEGVLLQKAVRAPGDGGAETTLV